MTKIELYTDGACSGNPGPGGWAGIIVEFDDLGEVVKEYPPLTGGEPYTTNNKMEIMAAIRGLQSLQQPTRLTIVSDSQYLINTMTKGWKRNTNHDLWADLDELVRIHKVSWRYVRGHKGHKYNEMCDQLAVAEIKKQRSR